MIAGTVTLIKDYVNEHGILKKAGKKMTVDKVKCQELADGKYIATDKRYKKPVPRKKDIKLKKAVVTTSENTNITKDN